MAPVAGRPDAQTRARLKEIKLEDIDFEKVKACSDKHTVKRYIQLIEEDGSYFTDLLKACKDKLLQIDPKEYFLLYPRVASEQEVDEATRDLLDWQEAVKETDDALRNSKKDRIWDEKPSVVPVPVRGQEPVLSRPAPSAAKDQPRAPPAKKSDAFARDKAQMKDYYSAWDKVDVDALEAELDREEQEQEESRKRHFEDLRDQQADAQATSEIGLAAAPESVPKAHWSHMADSEKEKGNEAFYSKDYDEAEAYYSRSIHFRSDDPSSWANRALVRLKLDRPSEALEDCEHALALNSRYMKALHRKGKALHELRRYEDAVRYFQLALRESPGNTQINGDLMVARRHLRSEPQEKPRRVDAAPTCRIEELPDEPPRTAGPAPGYTRVQIEEDSDSEAENEGNVEPALASRSTASDRPGGSEGRAPASQQGAGAPTAPASAAAASQPPSAVFHKIQIEEVSDSEEEEPHTIRQGVEAPSAPFSATAASQPHSGAGAAVAQEAGSQPPSRAAAAAGAAVAQEAGSVPPSAATFHKIQIVGVSDSEDEGPIRQPPTGKELPAPASFCQQSAGTATAPPSAVAGDAVFHKIEIQEASDSEEDELPSAPTGQQGVPTAASLPATGGGSAIFHRIAIQEVSDSDEDGEAAPTTGSPATRTAQAPPATQFTGDIKGGVFAPPPRSREPELPAAPAPAAAAPALSFDDMD